MKKEQLEKELMCLIEESRRLTEESEMELATAEFLQKQTDGLLEKSENPYISSDERDKLHKQMLALQGKLENEIRIWKLGLPKLSILQQKLKHLSSQPIEE